MKVRYSLCLFLGLFSAGYCAVAAAADAFPTRPVRMIVGFSPGGATDLVARIIQPKMTEILGKQVIVDNRPGANGTISLGMLARAEPDGYTVAFGHLGGLVISPAIQKVPYDPLKSFAPIGLMVQLQNIIVVHPSVPVKTLQEFIDYAKSKNGQLNYASSGVGSPGQLAAELLQSRTGIRMTHIPYKGGGPAMIDVVAGHVPSFFAVISTAVPQVKSGKVRAIAVTGDQRAKPLPDVPAVKEFLKGYTATNWYGLIAPAGTPKAVIDRLNQAIVTALNSPEVVGKLDARGIDASPGSAAEYAKFIRDETKKWVPIIRKAHIRK